MKANRRERNLVIAFASAASLLIIAASFLAPQNDDFDRSPTTYNSGTAGVKAAYLVLPELGFVTNRWEQPPSALADVDALHTTVIFVEPDVPADKLQRFRADIADFLKRGGRLVMTGQDGALLLPNGGAAQPIQPLNSLCVTTPEGRGPLARAGEVMINDNFRWAMLSPAVHIEQWCGGDAVVVSYKVGAGSAVWWSSARPITNRGLKEDSSLKLLLASITDPAGERRNILFDEFLHGPGTSLYDLTRGLPLTQIAWQLGTVALLLVLSFSRRSGPVRQVARLPRTSPLEFAESMGQLYRKAGATQASTEGARVRLMNFLRERCGLGREIFQSEPAKIAAAVDARFAGDWTPLSQHLQDAGEARYKTLAPKSALALVRALHRDLEGLRELDVRTGRRSPTMSSEGQTK
jgi:hypothetical protein